MSETISAPKERSLNKIYEELPEIAKTTLMSIGATGVLVPITLNIGHDIATGVALPLISGALSALAAKEKERLKSFILAVGVVAYGDDALFTVAKSMHEGFDSNALESISILVSESIKNIITDPMNSFAGTNETDTSLKSINYILSHFLAVFTLVLSVKKILQKRDATNSSLKAKK